MMTIVQIELLTKKWVMEHDIAVGLTYRMAYLLLKQPMDNLETVEDYHRFLRRLYTLASQEALK